MLTPSRYSYWEEDETKNLLASKNPMAHAREVIDAQGYFMLDPDIEFHRFLRFASVRDSSPDKSRYRTGGFDAWSLIRLSRTSRQAEAKPTNVADAELGRYEYWSRTVQTRGELMR
jgi:hypothetical protein